MNLRYSTRRLGLAAAAVAAVVAPTFGLTGAAAAAVPGTSGTAQPANNVNQPLYAGGPTTPFTLLLSTSPGKPTADCSADSATGGTYVYSFLVPQGTDPTTLTYPQNTPSTGLALFDANQAKLYEAQTTAPSSGEVNPSTNFEWTRFTASNLLGPGGTSKTWTGGLSCVSSKGVTTDIWTFSVTFSSDGAGSYTWAVPSPSSALPEIPLPVVLPLVGSALIGGAVLINRRRRKRPLESAL